MDASGNIVVTPELGPRPPDVLTLADLLNDQSVIQSKEQADKVLLDSISTRTVASIRPKLVEWILKGRPSPFPLFEVNVQPPTRCSDGEIRGLADYIRYCSGKSIEEHVVLLQAKLPDIHLSFANIQGAVTIMAITV